MDKVKLPKRVVDAIEEVRSVYKADVEYDLRFIEEEQTPICKGLKVITDFTNESRNNMSLYFQALVNGYEVELSKEDRVRNVISDFCHGAIVSEWVVDEIKKIYEGVHE